MKEIKSPRRNSKVYGMFKGNRYWIQIHQIVKRVGVIQHLSKHVFKRNDDSPEAILGEIDCKRLVIL